ncbi:hypothetical protein C1H76_2674 [Elsinoe australis]|uniref:Uncharacterized protein n=1 Tax=Elsinoe australis TaxID=40998 RepID=A0A4U7B1L2_9PEZI|nr:hypothetical protein C1H76_2674 [Elsinoe australis]
MGQSLQARDRGYSSIRRKKIPSKNSCNEAVTLTEAYKSALMAEGFNAASRQRAREAEDGSGRRGRKRKRSYDTEDDSENVVDDSGNGEETAVQAIKANFFDAAEKFGHEILDQLTARIARVERRQAATHAVHLQALSEIVDGMARDSSETLQSMASKLRNASDFTLRTQRIETWDGLEHRIRTDSGSGKTATEHESDSDDRNAVEEDSSKDEDEYEGHAGSSEDADDSGSSEDGVDRDSDVDDHAEHDSSEDDL